MNTTLSGHCKHILTGTSWGGTSCLGSCVGLWTGWRCGEPSPLSGASLKESAEHTKTPRSSGERLSTSANKRLRPYYQSEHTAIFTLPTDWSTGTSLNDQVRQYYANDSIINANDKMSINQSLNPWRWFWSPCSKRWMLALYSPCTGKPVLKHTAATNKHRPYSSHLHLRERRKGQMCTHTAAAENNKARHANWADGSFFCVHALASINITTEAHSCDSSLVSSPNRRTHLTSKTGSFTSKHESMQHCTVLWHRGPVYWLIPTECAGKDDKTSPECSLKTSSLWTLLFS